MNKSIAGEQRLLQLVMVMSETRHVPALSLSMIYNKRYIYSSKSPVGGAVP